MAYLSKYYLTPAFDISNPLGRDMMEKQPSGYIHNCQKEKKNVRHRILKFLLHSTPTVGVFGIALCWRFANLLINNNTVNAIPIVFDIITCLTTFFFFACSPWFFGWLCMAAYFFFFYFYKKLLQPSIVAVCHACAQEGATQLYTFAFTHLCQPTHIHAIAECRMACSLGQDFKYKYFLVFSLPILIS